MTELTIPDDASIDDLITEPAEDADGYRHDDLEDGSPVVYEGEICTVAGVGRSAIYVETGDGEVSVREGGLELVVDVAEGAADDAESGDEETETKTEIVRPIDYDTRAPEGGCDATVTIKAAAETEYGAKAVVEADYEAKDDIKALDWGETHREWVDGREMTGDVSGGAWLVDLDAVEAVRDALVAAGHKVSLNTAILPDDDQELMTDGGVDQDDDEDEPVVSSVAARMVDDDGPEDAMEQEDWDALGDETPNPLGGDDEDDDQELMTDGGVDEGEDESDEEISFTTDRGTDVTVIAEDGTLFVAIEELDITRTIANFGTRNGKDVLDLGRHRVDGSRTSLHIPIEDRVEELEALREASETQPTDEPLTYEVVERTERRSSLDGWGGGTRTVTALAPSKPHAEMTDRQRTLHRKVDTDRVPDDAAVGDTLTLDDLLDDARTPEEQDADALEEADETGEEVVIKRYTTDCNDPGKECNLDHVSRVATPDGEVETRRTHTY